MLFFFIFIVQISCLTKKYVENIIREWHGKEIVFPKDIDANPILPIGKLEILPKKLKQF